MQACRADPRLVLVNVKRGVAAVLGTKEQVKAVREHLARIAVDELHPFAREEIKKVRRTSAWLLENLTPAGARVEVKKRDKTAAEDTRDRLWTLLLRRHPTLRKVGYYFHGDDFEAVTPRLLSRASSAQAVDEALEEEPEAIASDATGEGEAEGEAP
ncbi:hypothetical protein BE08_24655 [Sorangium cellulosum]|uniref:Uncharacterized protein n=1 Tax=Sorangium cellulosum TaxID=56 RepID=A0A150PHX4_SORCE|nr:hypothetical protein BE08_24655 [Sorangium cellulosum]